MKSLRSLLIPVFILCLCLGLSLTAVAGEKKVTWKLASLAPKYVGWAKHMREIIHPAVKRLTNGDLVPRWYWGGIMGDDADYIDKMKIGQLDGAAFSGQGVVLVVPEMSVLELPFMFNNYDEVDYVRKKMFPRFDELARQRGYVITAWADQDFDQIYSSRVPLTTVEDFRKAKFLTWYGPAEQNVFEKLGVHPIPIGVLEISVSIRQNMADALIAPAVWILGSQLYTVVKYVNPIKIRYSPVAMFVKIESWNKLPKTYQDKLLGIRNNELKEFIEKSRNDSKRALEAMLKSGGLKKSIMPDNEFKKMQALVKPIWYEMAGKEFPKSLLDELLAHLNDFRSKQGS